MVEVFQRRTNFKRDRFAECQLAQSLFIQETLGVKVDIGNDNLDALTRQQASWTVELALVPDGPRK